VYHIVIEVLCFPYVFHNKIVLYEILISIYLYCVEYIFVVF